MAFAWLPALVAIPAMLFLAARSEPARYLLFAHHVFWILAAALLFHAGSQSWTWVRSGSWKVRLPRRGPAWREAALVERADGSQEGAVMLARLRREKGALDREIAHLAGGRQRRDVSGRKGGP